MLHSEARVATERAARYLTQLARHADRMGQDEAGQSKPAPLTGDALPGDGRQSIDPLPEHREDRR